MRKRLNDKGSALVTVIVACAVIGLLAVVSLWASLINYQMKITDTKGTVDTADDVVYTTTATKTMKYGDAFVLPALDNAAWTVTP